MTERRNLIVSPLPDCEPEIGRLLWMLEDCRQRTRSALDGLNPAVVDWAGGVNSHSIGTLLYHIAAIELDWLHTEVTQGGLPDPI
ncbi:MAG: DinB family protein [Anaerolineae bacterium]|nr:DinB family protein [Anaerolineae bacterium]